MIRIVLALLLGIVAAFATVSAVEWIDAQLYPLPADFADGDPQVFAAALAAMPLPGKVIVVLGWAAGALVGGLAAALVARRAWTAWAIAAVVLAGGVANIVTLPHPLWMQIATFVMPAFGGALAVRLAHRSLGQAASVTSAG